MAYTGKQYLDQTGLNKYDQLIKNYIDTEDAKAIKFAKVSTDGNTLLLYKSKTANAETAEESAEFKIPMGSSELKDLIAKLATAVGATYNKTDKKYEVSFTGDIATQETAVAAIQAVNDHIGTLATLTTTDKSNIVAAINEVVKAIADLDVEEFALTSDTDDVISIYGIKEEDGKVAKGASKIDLAKVAKTGKAEDVSVEVIKASDAEGAETLIPAGDAQAALQKIARDLNKLGTDSEVTLEVAATATEGYLKTYVLSQGGEEVGKIDIPKDYLVKSAVVKTVETADTPYKGAKVGDKYIDFEINVKTGGEDASHLYVAINDLIHPISGGSTEVADEYKTTVNVDTENKITVTLDSIFAKKVGYTPASATTIITGVTTVEGALDKIDTLIQGMDADLDAETDAAVTDENKVAVVTGIVEVDGKVTGVDSIDVDKAGAATAAYDAIGSIPTTDIESLFAAG